MIVISNKKCKKKIRKAKIINHRTKNYLRVLIAIIVFPLIVGAIYALPFPQVIAVDCDDLLSFYGTAGGILSSIWIYIDEKAHQKKEKESKNRPNLYVTLDKDISKDKFTLTIHNLSDCPVRNTYLYEKYLFNILSGNGKMSKNIEIIDSRNKISSDLNADMIIDIKSDVFNDFEMDNEGYPKFIDLYCEDSDGEFWLCVYKHMSEKENSFYSLYSIELIS